MINKIFLGGIFSLSLFLGTIVNAQTIEALSKIAAPLGEPPPPVAEDFLSFRLSLFRALNNNHTSAAFLVGASAEGFQNPEASHALMRQIIAEHLEVLPAQGEAVFLVSSLGKGVGSIPGMIDQVYAEGSFSIPREKVSLMALVSETDFQDFIKEAQRTGISAEELHFNRIAVVPDNRFGVALSTLVQSVSSLTSGTTVHVIGGNEVVIHHVLDTLIDRSPLADSFTLRLHRGHASHSLRPIDAADVLSGVLKQTHSKLNLENMTIDTTQPNQSGSEFRQSEPMSFELGIGRGNLNMAQAISADSLQYLNTNRGSVNLVLGRLHVKTVYLHETFLRHINSADRTLGASVKIPSKITDPLLGVSMSEDVLTKQIQRVAELRGALFQLRFPSLETTTRTRK